MYIDVQCCTRYVEANTRRQRSHAKFINAIVCAERQRDDVNCERESEKKSMRFKVDNAGRCRCRIINRLLHSEHFSYSLKYSSSHRQFASKKQRDKTNRANASAIFYGACRLFSRRFVVIKCRMLQKHLVNLHLFTGVKLQNSLEYERAA